MFVPDETEHPGNRPKNYINATGVSVEVETLEQLLADLSNTAPLLTRVIAHHRGTTHFQLTSGGWKCTQRVIE